MNLEDVSERQFDALAGHISVYCNLYGILELYVYVSIYSSARLKSFSR